MVVTAAIVPMHKQNANRIRVPTDNSSRLALNVSKKLNVDGLAVALLCDVLLCVLKERVVVEFADVNVACVVL